MRHAFDIVKYRLEVIECISVLYKNSWWPTDVLSQSALLRQVCRWCKVLLNLEKADEPHEIPGAALIGAPVLTIGILYFVALDYAFQMLALNDVMLTFLSGDRCFNKQFLKPSPRRLIALFSILKSLFQHFLCPYTLCNNYVSIFYYKGCAMQYAMQYTFYHPQTMLNEG
ncbi:unnamed protein product [Angiostrongylus costaricensis]|uniref:Uncharacterized protein n=1 Tax=Angiostrongylus costaricensis TaxID=334426 RepID=A0A0R3Q185_ANGCS|nr:unnamed protein product [Angiostrongylus costaricensis]